MTVYDAIKTTVREDAVQQFDTPSFYYRVSDLFEKFHIFWWSFKQYGFFKRAQNRDSNQGNPLVYGAALHFLSDCSYTIASAVKIAIIAKCADDLFSHYGDVSTAYRNLKGAIRGQYPRYHRINWDNYHKGLLAKISPSLSMSMQINFIKFREQTARILRSTSQLFKAIFKLSMCSRDIYLLTKGDSIARFNQCTELFANWEKYQQRLSTNYNLLQSELNSRSHTTDRIMTKAGLPQRSSQFSGLLAGFVTRTAQTIVTIAPQVIETTSRLTQPVFREGKITSIQLNMDEARQPLIPPGRFPPWIGHLEVPKPAQPQPVQRNFFSFIPQFFIPQQQPSPQQQNIPRFQAVQLQQSQPTLVGNLVTRISNIGSRVINFFRGNRV